MNILIIGNCYGFAIKEYLQFLPDSPHIDMIMHFDFFEKYSATDDVKNKLKSYDYVICSSEIPNFTDILAIRPDAIGLPAIIFSAYYPDFVWLTAQKKIPLHPLSFVSGISFWGFQNQLSLSKIETLYNDDVFEHLGYFDQFEHSEKKLFSRFDRSGLELTDAYYSWHQKPPFMHYFNHPKSFVLFDVTQAIIKKMGLDALELTHDCVPDLLANGARIFVYPSIAKNLGFASQYGFMKRGDRSLMSLMDYIKMTNSYLESIQEFNPIFDGFNDSLFTPMNKFI